MASKAAVAAAKPATPVKFMRDFFPIIPFVSPEKGRFGDRCAEVYALMAKGGCNVVGAPLEMLDTCEAAGLKVLVADPRVWRGDYKTLTEETAERDLLSLLRDVKNHPAVVGYFLGDEPGLESFRGLGIMYRLIAKHAPGKTALLGLFPNVASPSTQLQALDYEAYVRDFAKTCNPPIFGYDHYDLTEDRLYPRDTYWQNLELFRKVSIEQGIPFFVWVQAGGWFMMREPSAADQRFAVYTVLAYGAKGIGYYPYLSPQVLNYRMEAIDGFGHPSPTFSELQNLNLKLQRLGPQLLPLRSDAVYHHTTFDVPAGSRPLATGDLVKAIKVRDKKYRLLIGEFTHRDTGARYLMIVNCDLQRSVQVMPEFTMPPKRLEYFEPYLGYFIDYNGRNWIAPGEGRLLKVD